RRAARGRRTRAAAWPPRPRRGGLRPPAPGRRIRRTSWDGADARTAPPRAPPRGSGSWFRRPGSLLVSAVDLVEQLLRRHDRRPAAQGVGDELRGFGRAVAELLDHDLPHQLAQAVGVEGAR